MANKPHTQTPHPKPTKETDDGVPVTQSVAVRTDGGHSQGSGDASGSSSAGSSSSRIRHFRDMVEWWETLGAGLAVWVVGFVLAYIPVWWFELGDRFPESTHDIAVFIFFEGIGGDLVDNGGETQYGLELSTTALYSTLGSDAFGAGVAYHFLVPAVILMIAGYLLARRHIMRGDTNNALDAVIAGSSLSIPFALVFFLVIGLLADDDVAIDMGEVLLFGFLYALVFSAIGATIRSRAKVTSVYGIFGGIAAFLVGLLVWIFLDDPIGDGITVQSIADTVEFGGSSIDHVSDLEGMFEHFYFFHEYLGAHGGTAGDVMPEWVMIVIPLLGGAGLAYKYEETDPLRGMGEGAKLASGYVIAVTLVTVAYIATEVRELERAFDQWPREPTNTIELVSALIGSSPRTILLAGIFYPALFASIGGILGVVAYSAQNATDDESPREKRTDQTTPSEPSQQPSDRTQQHAEPQDGTRAGTGAAVGGTATDRRDQRTQSPPPQSEDPDAYSEEPTHQQPTETGQPPGEQPTRQPDDRSTQGRDQPGHQPDDYDTHQRDPTSRTPDDTSTPGGETPQTRDEPPRDEPTDRGTAGATDPTDQPPDQDGPQDELSASDIVDDDDESDSEDADEDRQ